MKQVANSFSENGATSQEPLAIIKWLEGLSGPAVILPIGASFEECEAIRELLEGAVLD